MPQNAGLAGVFAKSSKISPEQTIVIYHDAAAHYSARPAYPEAMLDELGKALPSQSQIIDIAAGDGTLGLYFARKGFNVTFLEPNQDMLKVLKHNISLLPPEERGRCFINETEARATGEPDGKYALAVIGTAAHWLIRAGYGQAAKEVDRIVDKDHGKISVLYRGKIKEIAGSAKHAETLRKILINHSPPENHRGINSVFRTDLTRIADMFINTDTKRFYEEKVHMDKNYFMEFMRSFSWYTPIMQDAVSKFFDTIVSHGPVEVTISSSVYTGKPLSLRQRAASL